MKLGLENLLSDRSRLSRLAGKRVAYVGHPASVDHNLNHGLDLLIEAGVKITAAFGPQHGIKGDKQDNMIESLHENDPRGFPLFSLYSDVRRPTKEMMDSFDVILIDMQDLGCRVYTYITTLLYILEESAKHKKDVWVLDRPNPIGREAEGFLLDDSLRSFVGASRVPLRHGLTMCELTSFLCEYHGLDLSPELVCMTDYSMTAGPDHGWPGGGIGAAAGGLPWVNPSPNVPVIDTARCYPGTVLLEGSLLSEGRGTTRPLQIFGAPGLESEKVISLMQKKAPKLCASFTMRPCSFEPTFHKFMGQLCSGIQWHTDASSYCHPKFKPVRLMALTFSCIRELQPELMKWRQPPYEYEKEKLPIDLLMGDVRGREWIDSGDGIEKLDALMGESEREWREMSRKHHLYD